MVLTIDAETRSKFVPAAAHQEQVMGIVAFLDGAVHERRHKGKAQFLDILRATTA